MTRSTDGTVDRSLRALSYGLAAMVLLVAIAIAGFLDSIPFVGALVSGVMAPFDAWLPGITPFVGLPLALSLALFGRAAVSRSTTDVVLAAIAVPCLIVAVWALYRYYFTSPGLYWGSLFTIAAGCLVAVAVLADAVIIVAQSSERELAADS